MNIRTLLSIIVCCCLLSCSSHRIDSQAQFGDKDQDIGILMNQSDTCIATTYLISNTSNCPSERMNCKKDDCVCMKPDKWVSWETFNNPEKLEFSIRFKGENTPFQNAEGGSCKLSTPTKKKKCRLNVSSDFPAESTFDYGIKIEDPNCDELDPRIIVRR